MGLVGLMLFVFNGLGTLLDVQLYAGQRLGNDGSKWESCILRRAISQIQRFPRRFLYHEAHEGHEVLKWQGDAPSSRQSIEIGFRSCNNTIELGFDGVSPYQKCAIIYSVLRRKP